MKGSMVANTLPAFDTETGRALTAEQVADIEARRSRKAALLAEGRAYRQQAYQDRHSHIGVELGHQMATVEAMAPAYVRLAQLSNAYLLAGLEGPAATFASLAGGIKRAVHQSHGSAGVAELDSYDVPVVALSELATGTVTEDAESATYANGLVFEQWQAARAEKLAVEAENNRLADELRKALAQPAAPLKPVVPFDGTRVDFMGMDEGPAAMPEPVAAAEPAIEWADADADFADLPSHDEPALSPEPELTAHAKAAAARRAAKRYHGATDAETEAE